jgi:hypothetical protein
MYIVKNKRNMKKILTMIMITFLFYSCNNKSEVSSFNPVNWNKRTIDLSSEKSLIQGTTYLSVYSQIYNRTEQGIYDLTATVSMRNTNRKDTIYIDKAEYFDTKGKLIRTYFSKTIYIAPMETIEIVIDENDKEGGTGANFLFDWKIKNTSREPLFEGIMITTKGQQGLSFTTHGIRIK